MADRCRMLFAIGSMSAGGSERQVVEILKHLDRTRFAPVLFLIQRIGELLPEIPADVPVIAFSDLPGGSRSLLPGGIRRRHLRELQRVIRQERIDVVYDRTYSMTLVAAPAARRCGVPYVSTVVSNPEQDFRRTAGRYRALKRRLLTTAYRRAHRVIANSRALRQATIDYYRLPDAQVVTVPNILDVDRIDRMAAEPAPEWEQQRFHVVTAGRLQAEKGQMTLLEAVDELVHRRGCVKLILHILGQGPLRDELTAFVCRRNLQQHVQLSGFVSNPFAWFARADLFCLPSLYEGLPNALIEAMACRTPVLATDCHYGPREILVDGAYGTLVPTGDAQALADAIEDAMHHPADWQARLDDARKHVEQSYAPRAIMPQLEQLFLEACRM